jgi:hypothetical protein
MEVKNMSVNARRIIEIKTEDSYISFNLWKDKLLLEFLDSEGGFMSNLTEDGTGIAEVSVEMLEKAVECASELKLKAYTKANLNKDITWAKEHHQEFIQYYCY